MHGCTAASDSSILDQRFVAQCLSAHPRDCDKGWVLSTLLLNTFAAALEVVLERFSRDEITLSELAPLEEDEEGVDRRTEAPPSTFAEGGMGNAVRRRCRLHLEIARWNH